MAAALTQVDQTGFLKIGIQEVVGVPLLKNPWRGLVNGPYQNLPADEELTLNQSDQSQIYYNIGKVKKKNKVNHEFPVQKHFKMGRTKFDISP